MHRHEQYQRWRAKLEDIKVALELLEVSADEQLLQEAETNLTQLQQELETAEIRQLLSAPYDQQGSLLSITAESDDADAQDWVHILLIMYYHWAEKHNYQIHLVEEISGDVAGIKSVACEITGRYAYGSLKSELGIHKLQRLSPFNSSDNLRTSLARVEVFPILDESWEFEIPQKHLEITLPRNQGNRNRVETWVQVLHLPTGITVFCDQERSPIENKKKALATLKSKLAAIALAQGVNSIAAIQPGRIKDLSNKIIREYILHPHINVKDLRTNAETTATTEVFKGEINLFIKAYLQQNSPFPVNN